MSGIVVLYTHWRVKLLTRTWGALGETTNSAFKALSAHRYKVLSGAQTWVCNILGEG